MIDIDTPQEASFISRTVPGLFIKCIALLAIAYMATGCAAWNPWGYSEEWPTWKKAAFFAGPGHCPVCYCVGGGLIEATQIVSGKKPEAPLDGNLANTETETKKLEER